MSLLHDTEFNAGNEAFGNQEFSKAIDHYKNSISIFDAIGLVDSVAYYNGALAADNGGLTDAAVENYLACARMNYQEVYCFNRVIILLKDQEKYEEAETKMEKAAQDKPDDPVMWFALGVVKDNLGKVEDAEAAYKESLDRNPDYFNSNMNLAILYFSKASKMIEAANEIPAKEVDKYNAAVKDAKGVLEQAVPYFEKAYEERPDRAILMDLKEAYGQLGDTENYKRVKALLDSE